MRDIVRGAFYVNLNKLSQHESLETLTRSHQSPPPRPRLCVDCAARVESASRGPRVARVAGRGSGPRVGLRAVGKRGSVLRGWAIRVRA